MTAGDKDDKQEQSEAFLIKQGLRNSNNLTSLLILYSVQSSCVRKPAMRLAVYFEQSDASPVTSLLDKS